MLCLFGMNNKCAERKLLEAHKSEVMNLGKGVLCAVFVGKY